MKRNELIIQIHVPVSDVFAFTVEPYNTKAWAKNAGEETVDAYPIQNGTIYRNEFGTLRVTDFKKDEIFELGEVDGEYMCRYIYTQIPSGTELTYVEWMKDDSELKEPFERSNLVKLKEILEDTSA